MTYIPERRYTYAVFFGCIPEVRDKFIKQLNATQVFHPMILPVLFADTERNKQFDLLSTSKTRMATKVLNIPRSPSTFSSSNHYEDLQGLIDYSTSKDTLTLWRRMRYLRDYIENWRGQLERMIQHVEEMHLGICASPGSHITKMENSNSDRLDKGSAPTYNRSQLFATFNTCKWFAGEDFEEMSIRIYRRLRELLEEYNIAVRTCSTSLDISSLANQVVSTILRFRRYP